MNARSRLLFETSDGVPLRTEQPDNSLLILTERRGQSDRLLASLRRGPWCPPHGRSTPDDRPITLSQDFPPAFGAAVSSVSAFRFQTGAR